MSQSSRLSIDVGGTFVDFVYYDEASGAIKIGKEPSLRKSLPDRVFDGIERLGIDIKSLSMFSHGSTTVINTIVQEKGCKVGLITTAGFRDVLEMGRGNRAEVYNLLYKPAKALVPRYLRFEVPERLDFQGNVVTPLDLAAVEEAAVALRRLGVEGIAICFLHSYANPAHERLAKDIVRRVFPEAAISISSDITREAREFERTSTVVLNTYVMPRMSAYLSNLEERLGASGFRGTLNVMQSAGGLTSSGLARDIPIRTLESGPAGGVIGAVSVGKSIGELNVIAADVGGTTFDVSLILGGQPFENTKTEVNRRPVLQSTIDIVSVGAGGGSIAWIDGEGGIRVGPRSAEADPGPACFGRGGEEPTVTDAQVVQGHINPDFFLNSRMQLDIAAARDVIRKNVAEPLGLSLEEAASGICRLADTNMLNAIRHISVERGHDPREFVLLCFGGGGGLFAGSLARELEIPRAIVPVNPAVFSAWGILNADIREDVSITRMTPTDSISVDDLCLQLRALESSASAKLHDSHIDPGTILFNRSVDMRYAGQEHTITVQVPDDETLRRDGLNILKRRFDDAHEKAYAHALAGSSTEIVNFRCSAYVSAVRPDLARIPVGNGDLFAARKGKRSVQFGMQIVPDCETFDREKLRAGDHLYGPAVIEEWNSTILVWPGQKAEVDGFGNVVLHIFDGGVN